MKLWLSSSDDEGIFGDGKWRLLRAIERESSLSAAAKALHISYRKAWGDLKKAEECLGIKFIEKHRGGDHGGKDGHPFPVAKYAYDRNIEVLLEAVRRARLGDYDRAKALKRLARIAPGL